MAHFLLHISSNLNPSISSTSWIKSMNIPINYTIKNPKTPQSKYWDTIDIEILKPLLTYFSHDDNFNYLFLLIGLLSP